MPKEHVTHAEAGQDHNRADSITPDGKAINQPLTHAQRMKGVTATEGHQGRSASGDYHESKRDEDRGGYGMADTDRLPADKGRPDDTHGRYNSEPANRSIGSQPGKAAADVPAAKGDAAKPGHETPEGRARDDGRGHDERGEYGKATGDFETPESYGKK